MSERDWYAWHRPYEVEGSALAVRLRLVQAYLRRALDEAPAGTVRLISCCAGQGLDVLGVLAEHPRADDVAARLVELDPRNTARSRELAAGVGLDRPGRTAGLEIVTGDAATTDAYAGSVPADVLVWCGVFGNVTAADLERTIRLLPSLAAPGASVIWTRHRRAPDLSGDVRRWFAEAGFDELGFVGPDEHEYVGVGLHRLAGRPQPFEPGVRLFDFVGRGDGRPLEQA